MSPRRLQRLFQTEGTTRHKRRGRSPIWRCPHRSARGIHPRDHIIVRATFVKNGPSNPQNLLRNWPGISTRHQHDGPVPAWT